MMIWFGKCLFMVLLYFLVWNTEANAAPIFSGNCSQANVQAAINSANSGDTVIIPSGTCSWNSKLTIGKSINVVGAGIGNTVIIDNVSKDSMIIIGNQGAAINPRISGMTISGSASKSGFAGIIEVRNSSVSLGFRIDHIRFYNPANIGIVTWDWVFGVIDHCTFDAGAGSGWSILFNNDSWGGRSYDYGDKAWADPDDFGTYKFVFVEDCTFNNSRSYIRTFTDSYGGARYVLRFNTFNNGALVAHGTDSTPGRRGTRAIEVYNNKFVNNLSHIDNALEFRSGTAVFYNNAASGSGGYDGGVALKCFRDNGNYWATWGPCDGTTYYDGNLPGESGYPCLDQPGRGVGDLMRSGSDPQPHSWPYQALSPVYIWGNTGFENGEGGATSTRVQENRDFYLSAKPGYSAYTYPHPLTVTLNSPRNVGIIN